MSFIDDHYGDIVYERTMEENAVNRYVKIADNQKVIRDLKSILFDSRHDDSPLARKNREIIQTVERQNGRMSERQKWCFCKFLLSHHDDYELDYKLDDPLKV